MPLPYMGSKRKHAEIIFNTIKSQNMKANTLCDLFCGGFAISEYFYSMGWNIIANDKNKYVIALLDKLLNDNLPETALEFIPRAKFLDIIKNPDNYEDWYVGFAQCVWTFGNNQQSYLYGLDVEPVKLLAHNLVVNKELTKELYFPEVLEGKTITERRLILQRIAEKGSLEGRSQHMERLEATYQPQNLTRLQHLIALNGLQIIEHLQRLKSVDAIKDLINPNQANEGIQDSLFEKSITPNNSIKLYSDDYRNIEIPKGAVIYCDPPYKDTRKYAEGVFNHDEFWAWVKEISKTNKIYVSEYSAPSGFQLVHKWDTISKLSSYSNSVKATECLYTYER